MLKYFDLVLVLHTSLCCFKASRAIRTPFVRVKQMSHFQKTLLLYFLLCKWKVRQVVRNLWQAQSHYPQCMSGGFYLLCKTGWWNEWLTCTPAAWFPTAPNLLGRHSVYMCDPPPHWHITYYLCNNIHINCLFQHMFIFHISFLP